MYPLHGFDVTLTLFFNELSGKSEEFDQFMNVISRNNLVKGGVFAAIYLFFWFQNGSETNKTVRKKIIAGFIGCIAAMITARGLAILLPYRERPLHDEVLDFIMPFNFSSNYLQNQSSFPSDHAGLFFALSGLLFTLHRKTGVFAFLYTILFIMFPRIYLGLHYFTDILAGFVIGVSMSYLTANNFFREKLGTAVLSFEVKYPGVFYAMFFLFIYQLIDLFDELRALVRIYTY